MQARYCALAIYVLLLTACGGEHVNSEPSPASSSSSQAAGNVSNTELLAPLEHPMPPMQRGDERAARGDFTGAVEAYRQAISVEPTSGEAHNRLGRTLILLARLSAEHDGEARGTGSVAIGHDHAVLDEGLAALERATQLEPQSADFMYWLGRALHVRGKDEEAIAALLATVEIDPDHGPAHKRLGSAYMEDAQHERALESYGRAELLVPGDPGIPFQLGNLLLEEDPAGAAQAFRRAVERDISFAPAHNGLAGVLARLGDSEGSREAQVKYKRWKEFDGRLTAALEIAGKGREHLDAQLNAGDLLYEKEDWDKALIYYSRALELDGKSPYTHLRLGEINRLLGDYAMSRNHLEEAIYLVPSALEPRFLLLRTCKALDDNARFEELVQEMTGALGSMSNSDRLLFAETLLELGERASAAAAFRAILTTDPTHAAALAGLQASGEENTGRDLPEGDE